MSAFQDVQLWRQYLLEIFRPTEDSLFRIEVAKLVKMGHNISWIVPEYLLHVSSTTKCWLLLKTFSFDASTFPRSLGKPKIPHLRPKSRNWDKWVITFHGLSRGLYCMYRPLLTYVCFSRRSALTCVPSRDLEANQRFLTEKQSRDTGKNGSQQSLSI